MNDSSNEYALEQAKEISRLKQTIDSMTLRSSDKDASITRLQARAERAEHVIVETGVSHEDLNACGCQMCEDTRKGLINAGYLTTPPNTPESDETLITATLESEASDE